MEPSSVLENGMIQLGFAGLCVMLLALLFWTIKQLVELIKKNNSIIAKLITSITQSTQASKDLKDEVKEEMQGVKLELRGVQNEFRSIEKEISKRPCIQKDRGM